MKITQKGYRIQSYYVDVYEDSWHDGEGKHVNEWNSDILPRNYATKIFPTLNELVTYITRHDYSFYKCTIADFEQGESVIYTCVRVDKNNYPDNREVDAYSAHLRIEIEHVEIIIDSIPEDALHTEQLKIFRGILA